MNDVVVGILGWVGIIVAGVWFYLFIKMLVNREVTPEIKNFHTSALEDAESIEYRHSTIGTVAQSEQDDFR